MRCQKSQQGFSLVEVLIAMAISSIVIAGTYEIFYSQQRSYLAQNRVVEMQQNLRAGLYLMVKDIRSAGYDPNGSGNFGFVTDFANPILSNPINYNEDRDIIAFTIDDDSLAPENGVVDVNNNEQIINIAAVYTNFIFFLPSTVIK